VVHLLHHLAFLVDGGLEAVVVGPVAVDAALPGLAEELDLRADVTGVDVYGFLFL
jgi:hypothetical protein